MCDIEDNGSGKSSDQFDVLSDVLPSMDNSSFTVDQEQKYTRRYEEGYDLPDAEYDAWLRAHHPDHLRVATQPDTGGENTPTSVTTSATVSTANGT